MPEQKIYMFNALWFKPDGGREKYKEYLKATAPILARYGGRPITPSLKPDMGLIGEFDADLIFVVEYPSWETFKTFTQDPEYQAKALPLREAAITKSLLIRCQP